MTPDIDLLAQIDEEQRRLGLPVTRRVRVGVLRGKVFAALSRHADSPFTEGACVGESVLGALAALLAKLRATTVVACVCHGSDRDCPRCLGVGHTVRAAE